MQAALCYAPHLLPSIHSKNFSTPANSLPKLGAASLSARRRSSIKSTALSYDTSVVDYSSAFSVFPAEACEIIGGEACAAEMYPEVKLKPEAETNITRIASELIDREYLEYTGQGLDKKTHVLPGEACDVLGGEFCELTYQRGVY